MFVILSFILVVLFQVLNLAFISSILVLGLDSLLFARAFSISAIMWIGYILVSGLGTYYLYKVRLANLDLITSRVLQNFSFLNKTKPVKAYFSDISPMFMRLSLFSSGNVVINKAVFKELTKKELDAFLYIELEYSKTFACFVEVLLQRTFMVFWLPMERVISSLFNEIIARYIMSPYAYFYKLIVKSCRSSMNYSGEYKIFIPQVAFKIKAMERNHCLVHLFNYPELCLVYMLENKKLEGANRFEMDEVIR